MKLLIVLVLYEKELYSTSSFISLTRNAVIEELNYKLLVYDNSKRVQEIRKTTTTPFEYNHSIKNDGVLGAYKRALDVANKEGYDWILFLDDDTTLPNDFLKRTSDSLKMIVQDQDIVVLVSKIFDRGKLISPSIVFRGGIHRPIKESFTGISDKRICAIGSCSVLRTSFINEKGGFDTVFWLDCLDRWIFYKIHDSNKKVFISDIRLNHELSIENYSDRVTLQRYEQILFYEDLFIRTTGKKGDYFIFYLRLVLRLLKMSLSKTTLSFAGKTLKFLVWKKSI
ncbi:glycosyltransferase [Cyclobacteriaceae bacterium]|jgi:GT2 family glycosyltransferase|nr:glycosyltransferase [Cyclobacteriaceae bacterium]